MSLAFPNPEPIAERIHKLPSDEFELCSITAELLALQANTIDALADYLIVEARKFELTNKTITFEELKSAAIVLKNHAEKLAPKSAAAAEGGDR